MFGTMADMGKRDENRAETRERILAAARAEIARVGGVGLSMRAIAREVGMVSSAVYRYFPTREDLLTAMILESYDALAQALSRAAGVPAPEDPHDSHDSDAERWELLAAALRRWGLGAAHEFQLIYGTPIPGYVAPAETIPAAGAVASPFLACLGSHWVSGFEQFENSHADDGLLALAGESGVAPSAVAAVVAAISELVGFVGHELAGHFVGMADPADALYRAVVDRQVRDLGLRRYRAGEEWNLRFLAAMAQILARGPGMETAHPDDEGYRVDELSFEHGHVRLVWSFPGVTDEAGRPVRAGRYLDLEEVRAGFSPDAPDIVASAVVLNDFYPPFPPSADREQPDGIRWLGPPPPA